MTEASEQFWFNLTTREVERGLKSPGIDRAGPFASAEEAARAPELLQERSRQWAEDDEQDDE